MLISELCAPVRNTGDWDYATQLRAEDDGVKLWGAIPDGLVGTLTLKDQRGVPCFVTKTNDGSGVFELFEDAFLKILVPAIKMQALQEGRYDVHLKFEMDGSTLSRVLGRLSVLEGA